MKVFSSAARSLSPFAAYAALMKKEPIASFCPPAFNKRAIAAKRGRGSPWRRAAAVTASLHHHLRIQFCIAENIAHFYRDLARTLRLEFEIVNLARVNS